MVEITKKYYKDFVISSSNCNIPALINKKIN